MNRHFTMWDANESYERLARWVLTDGDTVAPRGQATREIQAVTIELLDPTRCRIHRAGFNEAIGAAEGLQLIGGFSDPAFMQLIAPQFTSFLDGGIFHGAYGPRIRHQLKPMVAELKRDSYTRRARLQIWEDRDILTSGSADYPCTMGFTFHIRDNKLSMHTHMRSNDVFWGWTYDVYQFCMLQMSVAYLLGVEVGSYFHHVDSFHLYERDFDAVRDLTVTRAPSEVMEPVRATSAESLQNAARQQFYGGEGYYSEVIGRRLRK